MDTSTHDGVVDSVEEERVFKPTLSVKDIKVRVARMFDIDIDLLSAKTRKADICHARQVAMFLCTDLTTLSLEAIGLHFGKRDHTTVIHSKKVVRERIETYPLVRGQVNTLRRILTSDFQIDEKASFSINKAQEQS